MKRFSMAKAERMESAEGKMTVAEARQALRAAKLRSTSCRVAVLQHLAASKTPLAHSEVADKLVPEGFDKSTIYRCLVEMSDAGLLNRLDLGDHVWRFELRRPKTDADHPHFVCVDCGKVECLPEVQVKIGAGKKAQVSMDNVTEVLLKGHCGDCQ